MGTFQGSLDPNGQLQLRNPKVYPPKYLSAVFSSTYASVEITVGNGGVGSIAASNFRYNIYFIPATFLPFGASHDQLTSAIASFLPFVTLFAGSSSGNIVYEDFAHLTIYGWYIATTVNEAGTESGPTQPVANPIDPTTDPGRHIPPNVVSASCNKSTITAPGSVYTDTIYTFNITPVVTSYLGGYQIYVKNYRSDLTLWESIFITASPWPVTATVGASLRLPTDAAGHTITFFVCPVSILDARAADPSTTYAINIASGP